MAKKEPKKEVDLSTGDSRRTRIIFDTDEQTRAAVKLRTLKLNMNRAADQEKITESDVINAAIRESLVKELSQVVDMKEKHKPD